MTNQDFEVQFEQFQIKIPGVRLPSFTVPESKKRELGITKEVTNFEFLQKLCDNGFEKLYLSKDSVDYKKYKDRLAYELETVKDLDFTDYFLLIWDIINFCDEKGIARGAGRGSCCGSLVLFLIDVTKIDPIKYDLFFERFISKARSKKTIIEGITYLDGSLLCDIDGDYCYYRRNEVIEYLENKFKGKTSKILTLSTLQGKILIKECGKLAGSKTEQEMITVAEMIPKIFGKVKTPEEAYDEVPEFKEWCDNNREVYDISLKLSGLIKNTGVHPSGYLISYDLLEENCPTQLSPEKGIVSSYTMDWTQLFSIKVDLLGLRAVSVIDNTCKSLKIKPENIDINDPFIYQNLQELKTPHGLFQIEADVNRNVLNKVKPRNLEHLSSILALGRPGSLAFVDQYARFVETGTLESIDPYLDKILKNTGGTLLYQETLLKIVHEIFGLTLEQAELVRRAVGKKKKEEMEGFKDLIFSQAKKLKLPEETAKIFWDMMIASADYSFNRCLSPDTVVETTDGFKMMFEIKKGEKIKSFDIDKKKDIYAKVVDIYENKVELYEIEMEDGRTIKASLEHKFLCEDYKMRTLNQIILEKCKILTD